MLWITMLLVAITPYQLRMQIQLINNVVARHGYYVSGTEIKPRTPKKDLFFPKYEQFDWAMTKIGYEAGPYRIRDIQGSFQIYVGTKYMGRRSDLIKAAEFAESDYQRNGRVGPPLEVKKAQKRLRRLIKRWNEARRGDVQLK